ncbi:response regulator transcription factor [Arthrobacter crusticola]|uniref:Response regulator transcription factor n=1 Tax=Arthrobacter crusticola TaxID=2547960 RepID=A0A4R5U1Y2_9MICC|nr:response regulator transcription factor [Arthrobacter crusticola]TDK27630.1 response regulator transcription factor [Arthrobacter crusticola]
MTHIRVHQRVSVHLAGADYLTDFGLERLFEASGFIDLSGVSSTGRQALQRVRAERPDLVILEAGIKDTAMPATVAALSELSGPPKVLILSDDPSPTAADAAFRTGAAGYLVRGDTLEDIAAALRIVHRGGTVSSCRSPRRTNGGASADPRLALRFKAFTPRDQTILRGIMAGRTNAQIARPMHVSEATIKAAVARIRQQLGVENRIQIAVQAVQAGLTLVPPGEVPK